MSNNVYFEVIEKVFWLPNMGWSYNSSENSKVV